MSSFAIKADRFVLPSQLSGPGYLSVIDGRFGMYSQELPSGLELVDRSGSWVAPGYVDTHIHGFLDHDVMDIDPDGINAASEELARHGTTSWLPTTLTQPRQEIADACESVWQASERRTADFMGARIAGIFLEGPFFTEKHKGAQNPANMYDPDIEILKDWQKRAHGLIKKTALAPERSGAELYCNAAKNIGVIPALGHSDASYEQGLASIAAGASVFVHTYNGMSGLNHRNPGLVGCAMTTKDTYAELICDGKHVHPAAVRALINAKGWDHVVLITDCLRCAGMPEGNYKLGDLPIRMQDNLAYLLMEDGSLGSIAGSVLTLDQAVKNVVSWGAAQAEHALRMASEIPARSCGIDDVCGFISPGKNADFNVLNSDLSVVETYIGGVLVQK